VTAAHATQLAKLVDPASNVGDTAVPITISEKVVAFLPWASLLLARAWSCRDSLDCGEGYTSL
jgi:hypothetical protein